MKRNAIARIIAYSILALVLIAILIGTIGLEGMIFSIHINNSGTVVEDETALEASGIQNIEIDWAAGSVEIRTAETDQITISEVRPENSKYKMTYEISDQTLKLEYGNGVFSIGLGNQSIPSKDLLITVPQDWICEELEIDGASLDIKLQDLTVESLNLDVASCSLQFSGSVDHVEIDGASIDMEFHCTNRVSGIEVDGASCELDLTLPKDCGFTVNVEGLSYALHTDLSLTQQGDNKIYGDGYCKINIDGVSCEVTIRENE